MYRKLLLACFAVCIAMNCSSIAWSWGSGHDDCAQLACEFLPSEVKPFFSEEEYKIIKLNCHFPDMPNKTIEQVSAIVGAEDAEVMKSLGYSGSDWLHRHTGRAATYVLLRKAFRDKNYKNAAFYISVLSHSLSDQGAINHTPILQFTTYSRFSGVNYGIKNGEEFRLTEGIRSKLEPFLQAYSPKLLAVDFEESIYALVLDAYKQAEISAELETDIAFGTPDQAESGMAKLGMEQLKSLLDAVYSAWFFSDAKYDAKSELSKETINEIFKREDLRRREGDPKTQAVYRGLFDNSKNPENPKAFIGLTVEPYGSFHITSLSYVGKMLTASAGRSLRDHGYAIRPISLWSMETVDIPDPNQMPVLVFFAGRCNVSEKIANALRRYVDQGGKLFYVAGADPKKIMALTDSLKKRADDEVPVSSKWGIQNESAYGAMKISFAPQLAELQSKAEYSFVRNPNFDGFCKPTCLYQILDGPGIEPLAWLDNGREKFCVAAKTARGVWIPEYLLLPFLFSEQTSLQWDDLRLDSFGEKVLLETLPLLLK